MRPPAILFYRSPQSRSRKLGPDYTNTWGPGEDPGSILWAMEAHTYGARLECDPCSAS